MNSAFTKPKAAAQAIAVWSDPSQDTILTVDQATEAFHTYGSRVRFIKTLPIGASLLDAGAGDGSGIAFKLWPQPKRHDLQMFAWSGERGEHFDRFDGYEVGCWPQYVPEFGGHKFDAVLCANFIEHVDDPQQFIQQIAGMLTAQGRIYFEWPRMESIDLPSTIELAEVGVNVMTGRYHDDNTHRPAPPLLNDVVATINDAGLRVVEHGVARVPMIDRQIAIHARRRDDIIGMTMAYWSVTGWAQYLIADVARDIE